MNDFKFSMPNNHSQTNVQNKRKKMFNTNENTNENINENKIKSVEDQSNHVIDQVITQDPRVQSKAYSKYQRIPINEILKQLKAAQYPNRPIISVGSGNGVLEFALKKKGLNDITCIDPAPESFAKFPENMQCLKPQYQTIQHFLTSGICIDKYVGQCALLLGWPNPGNILYDYEAVKLLDPHAIVMIYEINGGAAGNMMHRWLKSQTDYDKICSYTLVLGSGHELFGATGQCILLIRKGSELGPTVRKLKSYNIHVPDDRPMWLINMLYNQYGIEGLQEMLQSKIQTV